MPAQATKDTKQIAAEIDAELRDWIARAARAEGRTVRGLLERMIRFYRDHGQDQPIKPTSRVLAGRK